MALASDRQVSGRSPHTCVGGCSRLPCYPDQPIRNQGNNPAKISASKKSKQIKFLLGSTPQHREREKKTHLPHVTQRWPSNCLHPDETTVAQKEMAAALPTVE